MENDERDFDPRSTSEGAVGHRVYCSTRSLRIRRSITRTSTAFVALLSLSLALTACGSPQGDGVANLGSTTTHTGSPPTGSSGPSNQGAATSAPKALAFAICMRSHGVTKYPDPGSADDAPSGLPKVSARELGVSSPTFTTATSDCVHLLPSGVQPTQSTSLHTLNRLLRFADCMRSHGVSNWPDPIPVSSEAPPGAPPYTFDLHGRLGLDGRSFSPEITSTMNDCFHLTRLTDAQVPWSG